MPTPRSGRDVARFPAFQFYPSDWLASEHVAAMSLAQRGIYITLLCHAWVSGGTIPADEAMLARLCGANLGLFRQLWVGVRPCWVEESHVKVQGGVRLFNPRMRNELALAERFRAGMALAGSRGALARWGSHRPGYSQAMSEAMPQGSSSSSSSLKTPLTPHDGGDMSPQSEPVRSPRRRLSPAELVMPEVERLCAEQENARCTPPPGT